jgi:long-chain fatty acid transport protein
MAPRDLTLRLSLSIALFISTVPARANPLDAFGFGGRAIALGGAATASSEDVTANYYNPANLIAQPSMQLTLGYAFAKPELSLNGASSDVDRASGLYGGLIVPNRSLDNRLALSLSFYIPDDRLTRIRSLPESQPRFALFDNRPQRFSVTTSAAYAILPSLRVGAGITYVSDTRGTADLSGLVSVTHAEDSMMIGGLDFFFRPVRYPTMGLSWDVTNQLTVGLSARDTFTFDLDIGVSFRGDIATTHGSDTQIVAEDVSLDLSSLSHNLFSPRQLNLGVAWTHTSWLVTVDLSWLGWSGYHPPTPTITLEADLGDSGLALPEPPEATPVAFRDIFIPRVGIEWAFWKSAASTLLTRSGYFYEPSPIPEQTGATNYIDSTKHGWSIGLGLDTTALAPIIPEMFHLDWALQWIALESRDHRKENPADPLGDIRSTGFVVSSTLTATMRF